MTSMIIFSIFLALPHQTRDSGTDAVRTIRAIRGLHEEVQDLQLIFEGTSEFVGPADLIARPPEVLRQMFQGDFLYRRDGSMLLHTYLRTNPDEPTLSRTIVSLFRGQEELLEISPDNKISHAFIEQFPGIPASLDAPTTPLRILFTWYFNDTDALGLDDSMELSREEVDGLGCLKLRIDRSKKNGTTSAAKVLETYWIDLARGGHPLKVERCLGSDVVSRTSGIRLERFPVADGKTIWLPVRGVTEYFRWEGKNYQEPIIRELCSIVIDSVRLNQGIPDRYFTAKNGGKVPGSASPNLLRRDFEYAVAHPSHPPFRFDRLSVQKRLDEQMEEADRQSKMIEASSTARQNWNLNTIIQIVSIVLGVILLCGGIYYNLRRR